MQGDTTEPFGSPAIGRNKVAAAFDSGPLTSHDAVMLLAVVECHLGLCDRLLAQISDPRDPSRVIHSLAKILSVVPIQIVNALAAASKRL
ncbi:hypothetical protein E2C05_17650 [Paracraurococcus ruber]|nr:hypothetical protein E2C05_17650 [Paracraurococcus ruber]